MDLLNVGLSQLGKLLTDLRIDDVVGRFLALSQDHQATLVILSAFETMGLDSADEVLEVGKVLDLEGLLHVPFADH